MNPEDKWEKKTLGSCAYLKQQQFIPNHDDIRPYIGLEHISPQSLQLSSVGKSSDVTSNKFVFEAGDILFGKLRPYFRKVIRPKFNGVCSTDIWVVKAKEGIDPTFLFYLMASERIIAIATKASEGTKMPRAKWDFLEKVEIDCPTIQEQKFIGSFFSMLDNKIELNHQMNKTLEAIGQNLFKHWFIDYEFPNEEGKPYKTNGGEMVDSDMGEIPKGWKVGKIDDLCKTIINGGTPRRMESRFWEDGIIPWFKTGELSDNVLIDSEEKITQDGLKKSSCHLLPIDTIIIALYASPTVGRLGILKVPATTNQACSALEVKDEIGFIYVFYVLLSNRQYLNSIAIGSAQQNISQEIIKNLQVCIPPPFITKKFQELVVPFYDNITNNEIETVALATIRDNLLPKLLSGEIRVRVNT
jgi:type I restriction enzyme S subunit